MSRPDSFTAATHRTGGWMVTLAGLGGCGRRKWHTNIHSHVNSAYLLVLNFYSDMFKNNYAFM
jgi:hypothetical protein